MIYYLKNGILWLINKWKRREIMKQCFFCSKGINKIDYKNIDVLKKFISSQYKILPKRKTLCCSKHQRSLAHAIKRSRIMALIPFVNKHK